VLTLARRGDRRLRVKVVRPCVDEEVDIGTLGNVGPISRDLFPAISASTRLGRLRVLFREELEADLDCRCPHGIGRVPEFKGVHLADKSGAQHAQPDFLCHGPFTRRLCGDGAVPGLASFTSKRSGVEHVNCIVDNRGDGTTLDRESRHKAPRRIR